MQHRIAHLTETIAASRDVLSDLPSGRRIDEREVLLRAVEIDLKLANEFFHERRLDFRVGSAVRALGQGAVHLSLVADPVVVGLQHTGVPWGAFLEHGDDGAQANLSGRPHVSRSGGFGKGELVDDVLVHERDFSLFAGDIEPLDYDRTR